MERPDGPNGRIFISYRREDTAYPAGWLFDRLTEHYGEGQVFKDVDSIDLGDDFVDAIDEAVSRCEVLLALIGDRWVAAATADGRRRLDDPADFVRREVEAALRRNVRVVPVLVDGAVMPAEHDVPPTLAPLLRRQAIELAPARFAADVQRLVAELDGGRSDAADRARHRRSRSGYLVAAAAAAVVVLLVAVVLLVKGTGPGGGTSAAGGATSGAAPGPSSSGVPSAGPSSAQAPASDPAGTSSSPAADGPPPSGAPSGTGAVLVVDDFGSPSRVWTAESAGTARATRSGGRLRLTVDPRTDATPTGIYPEDAADLLERSPDALTLQATGRRISRDDDLEWGMACRVDRDSGDGYLLSISGAFLEITKSTTANQNDTLRRVRHGLDLTKDHTLTASCADVADGVRITLSVDGRDPIVATDTIAPLPAGTVCLYMSLAGGAPGRGVVDFDDVRIRAGA